MLPLAGLHIVMTRPTHQVGRLQALLTQAGASTTRFPLLAIEPLNTHERSALQQRLAAVDASGQHSRYDLIIFISANAVEQGLAILPPSVFSEKTQIGAIGKATAQALQRQGYSAQLVPDSGFRSEDFLALAAVQTLQDKRVLIVRGQQGRELLAETLKQRGATVDYATVYKRLAATASLPALKHIHQSQAIDIMLVSSSESLQHLLNLAASTSSQQDDFLHDLLFVVGSERTATLARQYGLRLIMAADPSDDAMLAALLTWRSQSTSSTYY